MRYRFDDFTLDTERFELRRGAQVLSAEPQIIELLLLLVEHSERMVGKEEINEKIWRGRIVSEAALSSRVKSLRQLLGDDGKAQRIIRTVHKKGFRFLPPVERLEGGAPAGGPQKPEVVSVADGITSNPTVAVLPFINLSDARDQEYFSDGISADLITHLSKHRWLHVIARNTSFGFKHSTMDVRNLGRELGARYIVGGSVQRSGNRVRISAHLIDSQSGLQKWAERYDREIDDIFTLQDEITEMIAARLEPEIGFAERNKVMVMRPANLQAWDCYHLGVYYFYEFTGEDNRKAQELLARSWELDRHFGEAYAWWAYAVVLGMVYWDTEPTRERLEQALAACDRALSLDAQNASFYALRARVLLACRDYQQAIIENRIAIDLNPTFAAAHCGLGDSLAYEGRYDEAMGCFEKAIALSPNDPQLWAFYTYGALACLFKRDFNRALEWTERACSIPNHQYWTFAHRAVALAYSDRTTEARRCIERVQRESPQFSLDFARQKLFYLNRAEQIDLYLEGLRLAGVE